VWKFVSFHARRNVGATYCSFVFCLFLKWMFHFYLLKHGWVIFVSKSGRTDRKENKGVGNNSFECSAVSARAKVYGRKQMTSDNWRCSHSFCGLWHLGCIMRALFIAYQGRRRPGALSLLFFITTDDGVARPFKRSPKSLSHFTWQLSFLRFAQFFLLANASGNCQHLLSRQVWDFKIP
jgi:hypothetical protein